MKLVRDLSALHGQLFDVVIIGGGIFGACAAWDATQRGLKVALIEKFDFASGVSANSFKIVHGGMRYLQHADIKRLRTSCHERSAFLRIAPHLVQPLPIIVPTYGYGKSGKAFLATGLYLYDLLTLDRNSQIPDQKRRIPWTQVLSRSAVLSEFPNLDPEGLTGGVVFNDGRMYNPTRLVLAFLQSAAQAGAHIANYVEAKEFLIEKGKATSVKVEDRLSGEQFNIKAKTILNASGPWAERLLPNGIGKIEKGTYSRDACFVIKRRFKSSFTIAVQGRTKDPDALLSRPARHLFLSPWRDYTLVGVWHVVTAIHPEDITVTDEELESFIDEINWAYPALKLGLDDVLMWNAGLVPFGENEPGSENLSYGKRSHILDHEQLNNVSGVVSLIGVRYTMGRGDAAKAVDLIQKKLNQPVKSAATDYLRIHGGAFDTFDDLVRDINNSFKDKLGSLVCRALAHNYGSEYTQIRRLVENDNTLGETLGETTVLKAEILHAIRNEMALKLTDIIFRRTDLATGGYPGDETLQLCVDIAATEMGWSELTRQTEIAEIRRMFPTFAK